jgi:hypothetical protein
MKYGTGNDTFLREISFILAEIRYAGEGKKLFVFRVEFIIFGEIALSSAKFNHFFFHELFSAVNLSLTIKYTFRMKLIY